VASFHRKNTPTKENAMKRLFVFFLAAAIAAAPHISCKSKERTYGELPEERESIHDRVVHIEPELLTAIPDVFRWCDRLDLKKHRINVGDAELYVEEEGKGTPLVLINGGPGGTHHYFHPWFSRAKGFARVIYYDQRGCGLSDFEPGKDGYSVDQAVRDLDAIRRALDIEKWVVLGYSYGGFLGQYYTISHPEHTAGLILLGASPGMREDTGDSRQGDFMSEAEKTRLVELRNELRQLVKRTDMARKRYIQLLVYNYQRNGDWKRQNYYKPSVERIAQAALYEWDHDEHFNEILGTSLNRIDLKGAFVTNPIPTLILEGKWDLTWGTIKPKILHSNHPKAKMIMFEEAGHGIYNEEPGRFFSVLKDYIQNLPDVAPEEIAAYRKALKTWKRTKPPEDREEIIGWGWNSSRKIAQNYSREKLEKSDSLRMFMRIGFALYDVEQYEEALYVFGRMQRAAVEEKRSAHEAFALIWQGHMCDLLGKRQEAVIHYRRAAEMNIDDTWMHSQYGLNYSLSPYAKERIQSPFQRLDNYAHD
jgi:proline iminopeptidase